MTQMTSSKSTPTGGFSPLKFISPLKSFKSLLKDPIHRTALLLFLTLRILLSLWMVIAKAATNLPAPPDEIARPYLGVAVEQNPLLEVWQRWDTLHYQAIAADGYEAFDTALFVPPLYPLLIRYTAPLLGGSTLAAGILIANLFFILSLVALGRLAQDIFQDDKLAQRAMVYLSIFPSAYFLLAAYTESIFLYGAIMSLLAARQEKWKHAGLYAALACLARLPGVFLLIPLAYATWMHKKNHNSWDGLWSLVIGGTGAAVFPLYIWLWLKLPPWTPITIQSTRFNGSFTFPGYNLYLAAKLALEGIFPTTNTMELIFAIICIAAIIPVWKRLPRLLSVYYLSFTFLYITRTGYPYPLLGMTRYVLILFPLFLILAESAQEKPWLNRLILYPSWLGLLFLSGQFAIWGWTG